MNITLVELIIPAIVGIVGSVTTYFVARNTNKKDVLVVHRQSLSEDERAFRTELREEIRGYREEIESLRAEMSQLRITNTELTIENRRLLLEMEELRLQLARFLGSSSSTSPYNGEDHE
ncbi:hypothetical protein [Cytobacillus oceanisediminis]|uniref:hypothetical protein n=1 Tax=Cytobacillus oceanisediminis TaxID=665099 RepID=UPI001FB1AF0E|nr:hypothetical protein [Cytobacillus oceanisediminis]UOE58214.1 hypothetical protein IRB79_27315 [Cytobacillus oceanisediminis]